MKHLLIALTIAALAVTGCKGETKDPSREPATVAPDPSREPATVAPNPSREPATVAPDPSRDQAEGAGADREGKAEPEESPATATAVDKTVVVFETNKGVIKIELTPERTPITVENFVKYVEDGFYPGTIIHRSVPGFVIQGGGFTEDFSKKETRDAIENEAAKGVKNVRGTISMARTRARGSATSQFFISLKDNAMLDYSGEHATGWGYAAFGNVIEGMDVVDTIAAIPTVRKGPFPKPEVPSETVLIEKAFMLQ